MLGLSRDQPVRPSSEPPVRRRVGKRLRDQRESSNTTIAEIAERTKIHASILQALEDEDARPLPSPFFALSFLRQYSAALGFEPSEAAELEEDMKALIGSPASGRATGQRIRGERRSGTATLAVRRLVSHGSAFLKRHGQVLAALCLIAAGTLGWWLMKGESDPVAQTLATPEVTATQEPSPEGTDDDAATQVETPAARAEQPVGRASVASASQASSVLPNWGPSQHPRVVVVAAAPVWVRWKVDSAAPTSTMLQPGSPIQFQVAEAAYLTTGNVGNTSIQIEGVRQELEKTASVRHYRITGQGIEGIPPSSF